MYQENLSSSKPGLIMIMIDQSGSMADSYANSTKAKFAALAVNRIIAEIISACTLGDEIKDRCYVSVIGYTNSYNHNNINVLFVEKVSELAKNTNVISLKKKVSDGAGGLVEVDEIIREFVTPVSTGGTPMGEAFTEASNGVERFIANFPDSFPPIIINITDGEPNDFDLATREAKKLAESKTNDGNVIILNAHISNASGGKFELPSNDTGFSNNQFAQFLFSISSILPETLASRARDLGFNVESDARGFVFNADAETLVKILNFGSLGALR